MKKNFLIGITIGSIALFGMITLPRAEAASEACKLRDGLQSFVESRDAANASLELDSRKGLLFIIIDCTKDETNEALATLDATTLRDSDLASAKSLLSDNLHQESEYVDAQKDRVSDVGLRGTRDIARSIKEWRLNTHLPQVGNVNNFVLLGKNQDALKTAQNRAKQIEQTLRNLKLSDRTEISQYVKEANGHISDAAAATQNATESLKRLNNPDTTARLIKTSFDSLSSAYTSFLGVSDEVKKILPF